MDEKKISGEELDETEATEASAEPEVKETEAKETENGKGSKKTKKLEAEIESLKGELEKKEQEISAANDKYMRMIAEYDNFRRRTLKEKESIYADAYDDAMKAVLPTLDNIERACMYTDGDAVLKGLQMIQRSFADALANLGITEIECFADGHGLTFDPSLHNAVMHIEDESFGEGEIVEVLQKGYRKGERVLRYAMVKVAN